MATAHTPSRKTARGMLDAKEDHGACSSLSPVRTSISTSMPAEKAPAAAKMKKCV